MQNFAQAMRQSFRYTVIIMAIAAAIWAILPEYRLFTQSLLLGITGGLLNGIILLNKTWRVGQVANDPSVRPRGTGMASRLATAAFVVILTVRFPQLFILSGALIGLFIFQIFSFFFVYRSLK